MGNVFRKILIHLSIYKSLVQATHLVGAQILIQLLGIASFLVYSYLLPPNDFGVVSLFYSYALIFTSLISVHLHDTIYRYYYEQKVDFYKYVYTALLIVALLFSLFSLLLFLFRDFIFGHIIKNFSKNFLPLLLIYALATVFYLFVTSILTARRKTKETAIVNVIYNYGKFALGVLFLIVIQQKSPSISRILGETVAVGILGVAFLIYIFSKTDRKINSATVKLHYQYAYSMAVPFLFLNFSEMILGAFDQWFINNYYGNYETGIYSFGYKIGAMLIGLSQALILAFNNDYYECMNAGSFNKVYNQTMLLMRLIALATIGMMFFSNDVVVILARRDAYYESIPIVKVVALGCFFQIMYSLYARNFVYSKRVLPLTYLLVFMGILNIILNYFFIPRFGYIAAAYTTLASYFIGFLAIVLTERKFFNYGTMKFKSNLSIIILTSLCFVLSNIFTLLSGWGPFFLKGIIFIAVFAILFADRIREFLFGRTTE